MSERPTYRYLVVILLLTSITTSCKQSEMEFRPLVVDDDELTLPIIIDFELERFMEIEYKSSRVDINQRYIFTMVADDTWELYLYDGDNGTSVIIKRFDINRIMGAYLRTWIDDVAGVPTLYVETTLSYEAMTRAHPTFGRADVIYRQVELDHIALSQTRGWWFVLPETSP